MPRPWTFDGLDRWESGLVARLPTGRPPALLTGISDLAHGGRLWYLLAAVMATRPGPPRRLARDGAVAALLAAGCAQTLNRLVARPRPRAGHLPALRSLLHQPSTPSFPSSHSAVAAAFTTAVGRRSAAAAVPLVPLACAIAYTRVRTRAHWPTDVAGGVLLGAAVGELVHRRLPDRTVVL